MKPDRQADHSKLKRSAVQKNLVRSSKQRQRDRFFAVYAGHMFAQSFTVEGYSVFHTSSINDEFG